VTLDDQTRVARDAQVAQDVQRVLIRHLNPWIIVRRIVLVLLVCFGWFCDLGAFISVTSPHQRNGESLSTAIGLLVILTLVSAWGTLVIARRGKGPQVHQLLWPTQATCQHCGGPLASGGATCPYCGYQVEATQDSVQIR
jgi:hypothetical protein